MEKARKKGLCLALAILAAGISVICAITTAYASPSCCNKDNSQGQTTANIAQQQKQVHEMSVKEMIEEYEKNFAKREEARQEILSNMGKTQVAFSKTKEEREDAINTLYEEYKKKAEDAQDSYQLALDEAKAKQAELEKKMAEVMMADARMRLVQEQMWERFQSMFKKVSQAAEEAGV